MSVPKPTDHITLTHYSDEHLQFRIKEDCVNITALTCDLTAETPSVPYVHYKAKVLANGAPLGKTLRFKPIADSKSLHAHSNILFLFVSSKPHYVTMFINSSVFVPIATFGAPIVSAYTTESSLNVDVMLPMGPNGVSIADIITRSKIKPFKIAIYYYLEITEPEWAKQKVSLHCTGELYIFIAPSGPHDIDKFGR